MITIPADSSPLSLRAGAVATLLTATTMLIAAWWVSSLALALGGGLLLAAALGAFWETSRPAPRLDRQMVIWMVVLSLAGFLVPRAAALAVVNGLSVIGLMAALVLEKRTAVRVVAASATLAIGVFVWLYLDGGEVPDLVIAAALVAGSYFAGLVVVFAARHAIDLSRESYESLFNGVPVGLFRSRPDGTILAVNDRLVKMLGFADEESLLAINARDLYFDAGDRLESIHSIESGGHNEVLFPLKRLDGHPIWVRETARAILDDSGEVEAYEGVLEDVTDRTRAEQSALRAKARFAIAFEAAPIGMALVDMSGRFQRVNRAFSALFGRDAEELMVMNWRDLTPAEDEDSSAEPVRAMRPGDTLEYERRYYHSSGEARWGRVSISMFEPAPDEGPQLVVQLADITAQKELQESLEQLVRAKDEFVASVSHELRTPLTAVFGLSRELADHRHTFTEGEAHELLQLVAEQSGDVAHIVEDLLVSARADIGALTIAPAQVDVTTELEQALKECQHLRGSHSVEVKTVNGRVGVVADPTRLRQIIRNLLTNAFRYGGERVGIELESERSTVKMRVSDDGDGLSKDDWERIFEPYYRAHPSSNVTGSIGLGLAVSKRLAEAMDGELSYRYADGRSVFELSLPRAD